MQLNGAFTFTGGSGNNTLVAQADTNWTLDNNTLTAGNGDSMNLAGVQSVRLVGGSGKNRLEVIHWSGEVTLDGAGGDDEFVVHPSSLGVVRLEDSGAGSDLDTLTVVGTGGADSFLVSGTQVWLGTQTMDYSGAEVIRIAGAAGNDTLDVADAAAGKVILDGGDGADTYDIFEGFSSAAVYVSDSGASPTETDELRIPSGTSSPQPGVYVVGGKTVHFDATLEQLGFTTVSPILVLQGSAGDDTITLTSTTLTLNGISINLAGVLDLTIDAIGGDDSFTVTGVPGTLTHLAFIGGAGDDSLAGPNGAMTWTLTGNGSGTASGAAAFDFSDMESLSGGAGDDRFVFAGNSAQFAGDLKGGSGSDTLDYSARSAAATFDYGAGTATAVGGEVSGIDVLVGGSGADTLVGTDAGDTWNLTGANAGDINGALSFSAFENATGGSGDDRFLLGSAGSLSGTLDGGDGEDTLSITLSDAADTVAIGGSVVTLNGAGRSYAEFETLDVDTLGGADALTVDPSAAGFPTTVNLNSGDDDDSITINLLAGAATTINVDGGAPSASDSVIINGTADADTIAVDGLTVTFDATRVLLSGTENLTVAAGGGDDQLELTGTSVTGSLSLLGGAGDDTVSLNYGISTGTLTVDGGTGANDALVVKTIGTDDDVTLSATQVQIAGQSTANYAGFDTLALNLADGADNVTVADTSSGTATTLDTGTDDDTVTIAGTSSTLSIITGDGADTVDVRAIGGTATIDAGTGNDTVNVGSLAPGLGGVTGGIAALLTLEGGDGVDALNVDDSGDATGRSGMLTDTTLDGLGMTGGGIAYSGLEALYLTLGSGGDSFTIAATHPGSTTLNANAGADTINVRSTAGATTIDGGSGDDTVNVGSLAPATGGGVNGTSAHAHDRRRRRQRHAERRRQRRHGGQHRHADRHEADRSRHDGRHHLRRARDLQHRARLGRRHIHDREHARGCNDAQHARWGR